MQVIITFRKSYNLWMSPLDSASKADISAAPDSELLEYCTAHDGWKITGYQGTASAVQLYASRWKFVVAFRLSVRLTPQPRKDSISKYLYFRAVH